MKKVFGAIVLLLIFIAVAPKNVYAGNPPDEGKSSVIGGNPAPADGTTSTTVTVTLKDASGANLSSNDSILITSSDSTTKFDPSTVTLNGSGSFTMNVKSSYVGAVPVTVTDQSTSNTNITGSVSFYQPGTTAPTVTPTPQPGACTDSAPGSTTQITSVVSSGAHSITLTWKDANSPVSYYLLSYGLSSGNYIYGNPNIGGQGTTSYTVGGLNTGTKYYFVIRAGNGCTPGNYSNEMSAVAGGSPTPTPTVASATNTTTTIDTSTTGSTDQITAAPTDTPTPEPTDTPAPTLAPSGNSAVKTIVIIGTILGVLIILGIGIWIFINYRRQQRPPQMYQ